MATIDDLINGSFNAIGANRGTGAWGTTTPKWATPSPVGSPFLSASERAQLEQQIAQSKALQANMLPAPVVASGPSWNTPTSIDLAAIDKWNAGMSGNAPGSMLAMFPDSMVNPAVAAATSAGNPAVTNVQGTMLPRRSSGGFLELLFGPSKNGMDGLPGLLGGPGAGGILGMLTEPRKAAPVTGNPDRIAQGLAIGEANRRNPNPTYSKSGANNAFMPRSYQNSVRKQTGY